MFNIEEINDAYRKEQEKREFILSLGDKLKEGGEITEQEKIRLLEFKKDDESKSLKSE
jgi:hypothetical protein